MILSTSDHIEGREIVETIGIVRGNAARARGIGYDITAGIRNIFGGAVPEYRLPWKVFERDLETLEKLEKELERSPQVDLPQLAYSLLLDSRRLLESGCCFDNGRAFEKGRRSAAEAADAPSVAIVAA